MLVDAGMHPVVAKSDDLRPYLKEPWKSTGLPSAVNRDLMRPVTPWHLPGSEPASGFPGSDPAMARKTLLEDGGLDYVVLLPLTRGMMPNLRREVAVAAATNDWLAATWLSPTNNPDGRFKGTIRIVPRSPQDAVAEIERWAGHPHFVQVGVPLATHLPYGRQEYLPVWQAAAKHGLPVAVHDDGGGIGIEFPPTTVGYPTTFAETFNMRPFNSAIQLCSLICEGVLEQIKDIVFVFADGSFDAAGPMLWRLDKDWKAARSEMPWVERLPSSYLKDHVRFLLQRWDGPPNPADFGKVIDIWGGADVVMYSSNYPYWDYFAPQDALAGMAGPARAAIMGSNAARLYRLSERTAANKVPVPA